MSEMTFINYVLCFIIFLFICSNLVFAIKYYNLNKRILSRSKKFVDWLYKEHDKIRQELDQKSTSLQYRERTANIEYNKLKENFEKKQKEIQNEYQEKKEADEKELEEAIAETEENLKKSVEEIDELIGDKIADLTLKNTLTFDCVCGKKDIPCFIDLTKENTFRCDKCNSVYVVQSKFSPIIIGRASSEEEFAKIVENRMEELEDEL